LIVQQDAVLADQMQFAERFIEFVIVLPSARAEIEIAAPTIASITRTPQR